MHKDCADAVFVGRLGERMLANGIQRCLARYCRRAGVWITCHQFRHTFASHMAQARMPVTSLVRLLGHERLRSTQIYISVSDSEVQADYAAAIAEVAVRVEGAPGSVA